MEIKKFNYKGCGNCPLVNNDCLKYKVGLRIRFKEPVYWEHPMRGLLVVFRGGEEIIGSGQLKDDVLYCAGGESTIYRGIKDFVPLEKIEILEVMG